MTLTVWLSLFTVCLLGAMSPGPSLAIITKHSLTGGRVNGLATAWAHAFGIGIYAFITLIGLAVVLQQSPLLFKTISLAGAAYLAYLGFNALRSKGGGLRLSGRTTSSGTFFAASLRIRQMFYAKSCVHKLRKVLRCCLL